MELCFLRNDGATHEVFPLAFRRSLLLPYIYILFTFLTWRQRRRRMELRIIRLWWRSRRASIARAASGDKIGFIFGDGLYIVSPTGQIQLFIQNVSITSVSFPISIPLRSYSCNHFKEDFTGRQQRR